MNKEKITINFCENCGNEVNDRDEVCSCERLPYQSDNFKIYNPENKNIENFTEEDWDKDSEVSDVKYCKLCGDKYDDLLEKHWIINEETGEVLPKCSCYS